MTSKHLFFKTMREDLRHKTWMLALSVLASFIAFPVSWLLTNDNDSTGYTDYAYYAERVVRNVMNFFEEYVTILGGVCTVVGAIIVGLFGFRYVHHKNMVDTYHSMPVKRNTLFAACWLNGFLLWLIPFFTMFFITCLLAVGTLISVGKGAAIGTMVATAAVSFLTILIVFLLVYNLILVAVMLSGNILNTLVSMAILGFGVIGVYVLGILFLESYMRTFSGFGLQVENVTYFSPLFAAGYLFYARFELLEEPVRLWTLYGLNFLVSVGLSIGSWLLYLKRSSELAEQGIKNKPLIALMKLIVGVAAGMCGWLLLMLLASRYTIAWGIFGCVLVTVVVFGILDIIFHMDFKAFLKHKVQMGLTTVLALLLCFAFYYDWMGYDAYLPDKDRIAEIAVYDDGFGNCSYYRSSEEILDAIHIRDVDAGYALLETVVEGPERFKDEDYGYYRQIPVRVQLKSGRSYYRYYYISVSDKDLIWPLFTSEEYLSVNYELKEDEMAYCADMTFERNDIDHVASRDIPKEHMVAVMEAYNRDLYENTESVILNHGQLLVQIRIEIDKADDFYCVYLDVYEDMTHTVSALKQLGYGDWLEMMAAEDVSEIKLFLGNYPEYAVTPEELIAYARVHYGVYTADQSEEDVERILNEYYQNRGYEYYKDGHAYGYETTEMAVAIDVEYLDEPYVSITDKAEIEELLNLLDYTTKFRRSSVFNKDTLRVEVVDVDDRSCGLRIQSGALPEKYIQRFGEIDLNEFVNQYYEK